MTIDLQPLVTMLSFWLEAQAIATVVIAIVPPLCLAGLGGGLLWIIWKFVEGIIKGWK